MDPAQDDMPKLQSKSPSRGQAESTAEVVPDTLTPAQNRRIFIKTNCIVLVIMMLASFIAFLDKVSMVTGRPPRCTSQIESNADQSGI